MGIIVENVTRVFEGKTALDNVSLEIKDGDFALSWLHPDMVRQPCFG